jgi:hypothetical protein
MAMGVVVCNGLIFSDHGNSFDIYENTTGSATGWVFVFRFPALAAWEAGGVG